MCAERTLSTLDSGVESLRRSGPGGGADPPGAGAPPGDFIPDLAARFLAENPGKEIHFTFGHRGHSAAAGRPSGAALRPGLFLYASGGAGAEWPRPVVRQDLVLVVPPDHPLAGRKSIDLEETLSYPYVSFSRGSGMRDTVDALVRPAPGPPPGISCETEEMEVVAGLAARGFGIAVVPRMDLLDQLPLKVISIARPAWERSIYMVSDERIYLSPVVRNFQRFVLEQQGGETETVQKC